MCSNAPVWAVVPAAGSGQRMGAAVPKQYLRFQHKSVIEHTLDRLLSHEKIEGVVSAVDVDAIQDADWSLRNLPDNSETLRELRWRAESD